MPDREHDQRVDQARDDEAVVLQQDQVREEHHQTERDQRCDESHHRRVQVVAEARQIPRAAAQRHLGRPELLREQHAHRSHAPAVLLDEERCEYGRAHAGRQGNRDVFEIPALATQVESGVDVL